LRAHGVFSRSELSSILDECVAGVITPGLELLGVDPSPIPTWMAERFAHE
jgi:hypothetical protein